eukprot:TRINITY_DN3209_c1_g9_i1.p1 TRINITY_DN3209_c1_g9~~TRINITY_DN3209_c1_g9_i1.p1  ORF type:complete len:773 (-),score=188.62 TRINITY_DN3209_c1_g9_i1:30-2348(-)
MNERSEDIASLFLLNLRLLDFDFNQFEEKDLIRFDISFLTSLSKERLNIILYFLVSEYFGDEERTNKFFNIRKNTNLKLKLKANSSEIMDKVANLFYSLSRENLLPIGSGVRSKLNNYGGSNTLIRALWHFSSLILGKRIRNTYPHLTDDLFLSTINKKNGNMKLYFKQVQIHTLIAFDEVKKIIGTIQKTHLEWHDTANKINETVRFMKDEISKVDEYPKSGISSEAIVNDVEEIVNSTHMVNEIFNLVNQTNISQYIQSGVELRPSVKDFFVDNQRSADDLFLEVSGALRSSSVEMQTGANSMLQFLNARFEEISQPLSLQTSVDSLIELEKTVDDLIEQSTKTLYFLEPKKYLPIGISPSGIDLFLPSPTPGANTILQKGQRFPVEKMVSDSPLITPGRTPANIHEITDMVYNQANIVGLPVSMQTPDPHKKTKVSQRNGIVEDMIEEPEQKLFSAMPETKLFENINISSKVSTPISTYDLKTSTFTPTKVIIDSDEEKDISEDSPLLSVEQPLPKLSLTPEELVKKPISEDISLDSVIFEMNQPVKILTNKQYQFNETPNNDIFSNPKPQKNLNSSQRNNLDRIDRFNKQTRTPLKIDHDNRSFNDLVKSSPVNNASYVSSLNDNQNSVFLTEYIGDIPENNTVNILDHTKTYKHLQKSDSSQSVESELDSISDSYLDAKISFESIQSVSLTPTNANHNFKNYVDSTTIGDEKTNQLHDAYNYWTETPFKVKEAQLLQQQQISQLIHSTTDFLEELKGISSDSDFEDY